MPTSFWRQSLCVMAAVGLLLWHFGNGSLVKGNVLSLRVIHQVVPPAAPFKAPFYLSEVTWALGLASPPPPVMREQDLMAALEGHAMRNGSAGPMAASYALLTTPMDPATAERVLARAPREETDQAVAALWRGRAAWAGGLKTEAVRQWEVAVGDSAAHRKRFAEGLYVASRGPEDVLVAADAAVALMYLSDCHQACQTDTFEMLREALAYLPDPSDGAGRAMVRYSRPTSSRNWRRLPISLSSSRPISSFCPLRRTARKKL